MITTIDKVISYALIDLGVETTTCVPGYGASQTFSAFNELNNKISTYSYHEEVAFTICHSMSIFGKRSACFIKAHGLMKAANSVTDSLYTDITAGCLIFVFDDKSGKHSDNILETESLIKGLGIKYHKADQGSIYSDITNAMTDSERRNQPVVVLIDSYIVGEQEQMRRQEDLRIDFNYEKDVYSHIIHPLLSDYQYKVYMAKKLDGNYSSINRPPLPLVPESLSPSVKAGAEKYITFFDVFKSTEKEIVTGDTSASSSFAFPPYLCIDAVTYMGGSIPLGIGAYYAGYKDIWCLTGDFGFIAAGHYGLLEAVNREIPLKVVIFYNKSAAATGEQPINKKLVQKILAGYEKNIINLTDPNNPLEVSEALKSVKESKELTILLINY